LFLRSFIRSYFQDMAVPPVRKMNYKEMNYSNTHELLLYSIRCHYCTRCIQQYVSFSKDGDKIPSCCIFNILHVVVSANNAEMYKFTIKTICTVKSPIEHRLLTAICGSLSKVAVNRNNV